MEFLANFSNNTRLWIYQSNRDLTISEVSEITTAGKEFVSAWAAHGAKIKADFTVLHNRFLVLIADQDFTQNSGCSIDSSVKFIKEIEAKFQLNLMDRMLVSYQTKTNLAFAQLSQLKQLYADKVINDDTIFYNPLVDTKQAFENEWQLSLKQSWHFRFVS